MATILKGETTLNSVVIALNQEIERVNLQLKRLTQKEVSLNKKIRAIKRSQSKTIYKLFLKKSWFFLLLAEVLYTALFCVQETLNVLWIPISVSAFLFGAIAVLILYYIIALYYKAVMKKRVIVPGMPEILNEIETFKQEANAFKSTRKKLMDELQQHKTEITGNDGEQKVIEYIKKNFNDDVFLLNDVLVKKGNKTAQIDHILICKRGIFCLETKNFGIPYYQDDNGSWAFYKGKNYSEKVIVKSPQAQAVYHVDLLKSVLAEPGLAIYPMVVLANSNGAFHGQSNSCQVVYMYELKKVIQKYPVRYSDEDVRSISDCLCQRFL